MKKIKQINNLTIYKITNSNYPYIIYTPDKRFLTEFKYLSNAEIFCKTTKDFIKNKKREK